VQRRGPQVSRLEPLAAVKQPECNRGGSTVQTGDYVVTLKVGNETQRQVLRVERVNESTTSIISDDMEP